MSRPLRQGLGGLSLVLGALAAGQAPHGDAREVAWAVAALAAVGVGGYLWARPGFAAGLDAGLVLLAVAFLGRGTGTSGISVVVGTAALAALAGAIGAYRPRTDDVEPLDGILAVGALVVISLAMGALAPVPRPGPSFHATAVLLLLYLSTPPFEIAAALAVLGQGGRLQAFLRSRYGWRPDLPNLVGLGVLAGIGLLLLSSVAVIIESSLFGVKVVPNNPFVYSPHLATAAPTWGIITLIAAVVLLAPLAEELLFRGLLFGGLTRALGVWPAAILSALVFGSAHLDWSLLLGLALAGLALNGLYWQHRSLWVSTAAHATLNLVSVTLALLLR